MSICKKIDNFKIDFHCHTPASSDYGRGDSALRSSLTPREWLKAAMNTDLDGVVIADHNSSAWIDPLRVQYRMLESGMEHAPWFRPLEIFPGAEISVADKGRVIHLLAVFDSSEYTGETVSGLLKSCGIPAPFKGSSSITTQTCFLDTVLAIIARGGVAIPAHIDDCEGYFSDAGKGNDAIPDLPDFIKMVETRAPAEGVPPQILSRIGNRKIVSGSDSHFPHEIGRRFTTMGCSAIIH